jgi:hypothetical protein
LEGSDHSNSSPITIVIRLNGAPTLKYAQNPISTPRAFAR